jgi:hypothetical protein
MAHVHQGSQEPGIQAVVTPLQGIMTLMDTLWMRHHPPLTIILVSCNIFFLQVCIILYCPYSTSRAQAIDLLVFQVLCSVLMCIFSIFYLVLSLFSRRTVFTGGDTLLACVLSYQLAVMCAISQNLPVADTGAT